MLWRMLAISPSHFNEIFISALFSCTLLLGCLRICGSLVWTWTPLNLAASGSGRLNIWWARANSAVRIQLLRFNSNVKIVNGRKLGCHKQYVYSCVGALLPFAVRRGKSKEERETMKRKVGFKKKHIHFFSFYVHKKKCWRYKANSKHFLCPQFFATPIDT